MSITINPGENFYCQAFAGLRVPDEISSGVEIAPKVWAGRGLPVVPGEHWEKSLGELLFSGMRAGLVLTTTAPQPAAGHLYNPDLKRKLNHLLFGLLFQGVPDYRESFFIGGANEAGAPNARQFSRARVFYPTRGSEPLKVGHAELARAVILAGKLDIIDLQGSHWRRLRRAVDALTRGSSEPRLQGRKDSSICAKLRRADSSRHR